VILRLLSYNIRYGGRGRERLLAAVINRVQPDLVVFQEATRPEVIERIAHESGMAEWATRPRESLGYASRLPVAHVSWHKPRISRHAFIEIVPAGTPWRIFGVHLSAVHAAWTERRRVFELRALLATLARRQPGPHALVGDFNTLAPGELLPVAKLPGRLRALVWLSGGDIRWKTIATVLQSNYVDMFRATHPNVVGNTFPTWGPYIRLDYLFVPAPFARHVVACEVHDDGEARAASDHLPLLADIDV
jgi:endonuclease/exonuclease/phosphatase family metal-dependent hydrolase